MYDVGHTIWLICPLGADGSMERLICNSSRQNNEYERHAATVSLYYRLPTHAILFTLHHLIPMVLHVTLFATATAAFSTVHSHILTSSPDRSLPHFLAPNWVEH